jgi:FdhD protein
MSDFTQGAKSYQYWLVDGNGTELIDGGIIDEVLLTIYVNTEEIATIMCSPVDEEMLVLGFLYNEGMIEQRGDIGLLKLNVARSVADVFLTRSKFELPRRLTITSGCSGGLTTQNLTEYYPPLESSFSTTSDVILSGIPKVQEVATLYKQVRGVHTALLLDEGIILLSAEDVGRHNTIDKIAGMALEHNIETRDRLLFSSGRISSEMVNKARRLQIPVVVSRTAPTAMATRLALEWNICLIGYARRNTFRVYTHPQRVGIS